MKVLHISGDFWGEGAGTACFRISEALKSVGVDSSVWSPAARVEEMFHLRRSPCRQVVHRAMKKLGLLPDSTNPGRIGISNGWRSSISVADINRNDCDIVHVHHFFPNNFLSIKSIAGIEKPIVWTHHDLFAACGAETYPNVLNHDMRYRDGYFRRNRPAGERGVDYDRLIWRWKKHCWRKLDTAMTAPSAYAARIIEDSAIFRGKHCEVIPNPLAASVFHRLGRTECRRFFNLPENRKIVCFGATSADNQLKGGYYLAEALKILSARRRDILPVCFGLNGAVFLAQCGFAGVSVGHLKPAELAKLYNAADVVAAPSLIESFGQVHLESLFCGTPVVAFGVGGVMDFIAHQSNGYLAKPYDSADLASGIEYCLVRNMSPGDDELLEFQARFAPAKIAGKFLKLYNRVLEARKT